jgi:L,D-transpeptidase ErfK/SrfK
LAGWLIVTLLAVTGQVCAGAYSVDSDVVGEVVTKGVTKGESLMELARAHDLGYNEIVQANPGIDPFVPEEGAAIVIPAQWVLPASLEERVLLVNLSEMRLYYRFTVKGAKLLVTAPIGIGTEETETPEGAYRIVEKIENPVWHVPESILAERPSLPERVPPGPDNPLGSHAFRLSAGNIMIHGTNKPWGVGRQVSHGCIRLYPEDIVRLFRLIPVGTVVRIVREPVKVGIREGRVYLEVHHDPAAGRDTVDDAMGLLAVRGVLERVSRDKVVEAIGSRSGIPVDVTRE